MVENFLLQFVYFGPWTLRLRVRAYMGLIDIMRCIKPAGTVCCRASSILHRPGSPKHSDSGKGEVGCNNTDNRWDVMPVGYSRVCKGVHEFLQ